MWGDFFVGNLAKIIVKQMLASSKISSPEIKTPHSMIKQIYVVSSLTPWFATPSFLGDVDGLTSQRDDAIEIVNDFNGLVLRGKSQQETIDIFPSFVGKFPVKTFPKKPIH